MKKLLLSILLIGICFTGAYAADTITILDGLQTTKPDTADFYTIDTVGSSAVNQFVVALPQSANRVRVLYNNSYDTDGSSVYTRCRISKTTALGTLSKSVAEVDAFAEIPGNVTDGTDFREGATVDLSGVYDATLYIDCALSSTTAHTGTEILVQVSSNTTGDNMWETLTAFTACVGTAIKVDLGAEEAAGQTVLTVTNPVTNNLDQEGKLLFLEDTATPANSEIVYQTTNSGD